MNRKNIIITAFLSFLILCSALVVFGVIFHDEPTFVTGKDELSWNKDQFPLRVCISQYEGETDLSEARRIVELINKRLDFHALAFMGDVDPACVIQGVLGVPQEPGWTEKGGHARWKSYVSCEFRTVNAPPGKESEIIQHELGHCLGLAHDPYTNSIMFDSMADVDVGNLQEVDYAKFPPEISDDDKEAIRKRYLN